MDEVATHNSPADCWFVVDGRVYDASAWIPSHPGGRAILAAYAGKDVSREWAELGHSEEATAIRDALLIGTVADYVPPKAAVPPAKSDKKTLVVVGAGICGVSAAYHLSLDKKLADEYRILVVDRSHLIGGTALRSSAIMYAGPLLEARAANAQAVGLAEWLGQMSFEMSKSVHENWGPIGFSPRPMLGLANSPEELEFARKACRGTDVLLTPEEAVAAEPALKGSKNLAGAVLKQGCFTMDPYSLCKAYADRARDNGVEFALGTEVLGLDRAGTGYDLALRPVGTSDPSIPLHADVLLLCAGPWDNAMAAQLGHDVPVKPMHGQMLAVRLPPDLPELKHLLFSYEGPLYWARNRDGHNSTLGPDMERRTNHFYGLQLGTSERVCKFGGDRVVGDLGGVPLREGLAATREKLADLLPAFAGAPTVGRGWGGTMPFTPDQNVIVGELEPGLHVCTGAAFTKGGAAGMLLAAEVCGKYGDAEWAEGVPGRKEMPGYLEKCSPHRFKKLGKEKAGVVEEQGKEAKGPAAEPVPAKVIATAAKAA